MKKTTSWGGVADWYSDHLEDNEDSYQAQVILPNLMRLVEPKKGEQVLDLACGQGYFSRAFAAAGANVHGVDISRELIKKAQELSHSNIRFTAAPADMIPFIQNDSVSAATIVLAIQNIKNVKGIIAEAKRTLVPGGKLFIVMNHPAFRGIRSSSWGYDEETKTQYRRIDRYMSESEEAIDMQPGKASKAGVLAEGEKTVSFNRPLQYYFKLLGNGGFAVTRLEEWISHKKSEKGPRQAAEDKARKEFPLFLLIEAKKL